MQIYDVLHFVPLVCFTVCFFTQREKEMLYSVWHDFFNYIF